MAGTFDYATILDQFRSGRIGMTHLEETLLFLLGSRYCETDKLSEIAWKLFGNTPMGWARTQAICDYVHNHITFGYEHASPTKTAWEVYRERKGVCRDFAHLAVAQHTPLR